MWKPYWNVWRAHQRAVKAVRTVKGDDMVVKKACDKDRSKRVDFEAETETRRCPRELRGRRGLVGLRMMLGQAGPVRTVQQCLQKR
jgi:hypothetical protein